MFRYVSVEVMVLCPAGEEKCALLIMYIYYCHIYIQQIDTIKTADVTNKV